MNADAAGVAHDAALDLDLRARNLNERARVLKDGILYPAALDLRDTRLARGLEPFVDVVSHAVTVVELGRVLDGHIAAVRPVLFELVGTYGDVADDHVVRVHLEYGFRLADEPALFGGDRMSVAVHAVVCRNVLDLSGNTVHDSGVVLHGYIVFQHGRVAFRLCGTQLRVRRHRDSADDREREREGGVFRQIGVLGILRADGDRDGKFFVPVRRRLYRRGIEVQNVVQLPVAAPGVEPREIGSVRRERERFVEALLVLSFVHHGIKHSHRERIADKSVRVVFHGSEHRFARKTGFERRVGDCTHKHSHFSLHLQLYCRGSAVGSLCRHGHFAAGKTAHGPLVVDGGYLVVADAPRHFRRLAAFEYGGISCGEIQRLAVDL